MTEHNKMTDNGLEAGAIKPLYLFWGTERFLLAQALDRLIRLVAPGEQPFNLERFDGETAGVETVLASANMLPFFDQRKLLVVDNCPWFANKKSKNGTEESEADKSTPADLEGLLSYLQNPAETSVVVFVCGESINRAKKLCKAVAKNGFMQEFAPLKGNAALLWLEEQLRLRHKTMPRLAQQQLLLLGDYDCCIINNELEKLCLYVGAGPEITLGDVNSIVSSNATASIFNLVDQVAEGKLAQALRALEQVTLSEAPESILPRLADHFQTLLIVKLMQQQGYNTKEIMAASGKSHPFVIEKSGRQAAKYSEKKLQKALETLLLADRKLKGGVTEALDAIETAIIQICLLTN